MSSANTLAIRRVPIESLHLDPANARLHPETNLDAITASLKRFGQAEPLVVQAGTARVIAGNGRLVAMKKLGWTECDIVEIDADNITATALGIALNRTAELAAWDEPVLAKLLEELKQEGALDGVGYSDQELTELLAKIEAETPVELDDAGPEDPPENPVSRRGDLWLLGDHRILCGDSTSADDLARLMAGEKAALYATDPPYCVDYTGMDRPIHDGKPSGKDWSHVYREVDIADLGQFLDGVFTAALPHIVDDAAIYVWHAHVQQPVIAATFEKHDILLHQVLVWVKPTATFGHSYYRWKHEPCAFGWKRGNKPQHGFGQLDSVWEVDWEGKSRVVGNEHPTQKPLRLFEIPMEVHTKPGAIVLETFSGSGTQILAAERLHRRCRAMEISPAFVDVAVRRWEKATGKIAVLEATGQTFAEVTAVRSVSQSTASAEA
jgi:DNA modification methylase